MNIFSSALKLNSKLFFSSTIHSQGLVKLAHKFANNNFSFLQIGSKKVFMKVKIKEEQTKEWRNFGLKKTEDQGIKLHHRILTGG